MSAKSAKPEKFLLQALAWGVLVVIAILAACGGNTGPSTTTTTVPTTDEGIPGRIYEVDLPSGARCAIWYTADDWGGGIDCDWGER